MIRVRTQYPTVGGPKVERFSGPPSALTERPRDRPRAVPVAGLGPLGKFPVVLGSTGPFFCRNNLRGRKLRPGTAFLNVECPTEWPPVRRPCEINAAGRLRLPRKRARQGPAAPAPAGCLFTRRTTKISVVPRASHIHREGCRHRRLDDA